MQAYNKEGIGVERSRVLEQRAENNGSTKDPILSLKQFAKKTPESFGDTASDRIEEQIDTTTRPLPLNR